MNFKFIKDLSDLKNSSFTDEVELTIHSEANSPEEIDSTKNKPPFLSSPDRSGNPFCFVGTRQKARSDLAAEKTKRLQRRAGPPFGEETTLLLLNFYIFLGEMCCVFQK